jgi:ubiquinone/menaquinone biosynthesis C-methylase UbiE
VEPIDLSEVRRLYRSGVNVMDYLKKKLGTTHNTDQLVETAYDLQAGSYIEYIERHAADEIPYQKNAAEVLASVLIEGDSIVDVGTGEMTTLAPVAEACYGSVSSAFAVDISLSRLIVGLRYLRTTLRPDLQHKVRAVAATLFRLPFPDNSVDVVWTSHALEPNGGKELEAIAELARITRKYLVLFEPSYERNTPAGKERMERLGYVKNLEATIGAIPGLRLETVTKMSRPADDPNPTYAHIVRKEGGGARAPLSLACPLSHGPLDAREGYLYSPRALLAYPVFEGVPILRIEKGVCASILDGEGRP